MDKIWKETKNIKKRQKKKFEADKILLKLIPYLLGCCNQNLANIPPTSVYILGFYI